MNRGFLDGFRAAFPLAITATPIGILVGVAVRESAAIDNVAGAATSFVILAGAAQLAAIDLLDSGAGVWPVVAAVFMINARHLMYSAALAERFRAAPRWFRILGSYLLLDQVFALNSTAADPELVEQPLRYQMHHYLGTAAAMCSAWWSSTVVGVLAGSVIPADWEIDFAVPLMFGGLLVMSITDRAGVVAAVVGATVAVAGRSWPAGTGLLAGAVLGVLAAAVVSRGRS